MAYPEPVRSREGKQPETLGSNVNETILRGASVASATNSWTYAQQTSKPKLGGIYSTYLVPHHHLLRGFMDRLNRVRLFLSTALTAIVITLSDKLGVFIAVKDRLDSIIIAIAGVFLGLFLTPMIIKLATESRLIRRLIFKKDWIEGYWHNVFIEIDNDRNRPFHSITEISFRNSDLGYHTVGYRIVDGEEYLNFSQYVILLGESNFFFNYALSNADGPFRSLVACGYFYCSPGSNCVDTFEGVIVYPDGRRPYKLKSKRISDVARKKLVKAHGNEWMREYLQTSDYNARPAAGHPTFSLTEALRTHELVRDKGVATEVLHDASKSRNPRTPRNGESTEA